MNKFNGKTVRGAESLALNSGETPWLSGRVPNGYWDSRTNRSAYLKWLGARLGYRSVDDWYKVRQRDFKQNRGGGLLAGFYDDSVFAAVTDLLPDHEWYPWRFSRTPQGYWQDESNRRKYMKWLENELGLNNNDDWYRVTKQHFADNNGLGLLNNYYNGCVVSALMEYKPRLQLNEWLFGVVPQGFWESAGNFQRYMDWLGVTLNIRTIQLWYGVKSEDVKTHHGNTPLTQRGGSIFQMVSEYLPDHNWKPWLFATRVPSGYWKNPENRKSYLRWLGDSLEFRKPKDWYRLTHLDFQRTGGAGLFSTIYRNSLLKAARERYPSHKWNGKLFQFGQKNSRRTGTQPQS